MLEPDQAWRAGAVKHPFVPEFFPGPIRVGLAFPTQHGIATSLHPGLPTALPRIWQEAGQKRKTHMTLLHCLCLPACSISFRQASTHSCLPTGWRIVINNVLYLSRMPITQLSLPSSRR